MDLPIRHPSSSMSLSLSSCLQLERSYQRFTAFYASRHSGRKLTWLYHLSKGELVTNCFKNRYTLQVHSPPSLRGSSLSDDPSCSTVL